MSENSPPTPYPPPELDLAGSSPQQNPPNPNAYLKEETNMFRERRIMRVIVFIASIGFSCLFLYEGYKFTFIVGNGIVRNQATIAEAMLASAQAQAQAKTQTKSLGKVEVSSATSTAHKTNPKEPQKKVSDTKYSVSERFNWMSTGSLLVLVGFLLATGLTLMLTLMRSIFKGKEDDVDGGAFKDLATPTSKLGEDIYAFLKSKLTS